MHRAPALSAPRAAARSQVDAGQRVAAGIAGSGLRREVPDRRSRHEHLVEVVGALGELTSKIARPPRGEVVEVLKDPACELGADAVIVTRRFHKWEATSQRHSGAISWPDSPLLRRA